MEFTGFFYHRLTHDQHGSIDYHLFMGLEVKLCMLNSCKKQKTCTKKLKCKKMHMPKAIFSELL